MDLAQTGDDYILLNPNSHTPRVPLVSSPARKGKSKSTTACRKESFPDFVGWLAVQARLETTVSDAGRIIMLPEEERPKFGERDSLDIQFFNGELGDLDDHAEETLGFEAHPLDWLLDRASGGRTAAQAQPRRKSSVHSVSTRLFPAYQVEGGQSHLAGCQLLDRAFARLTYLDDNLPHATVRHWFVDENGLSVPSELVSQLRLDNTEPLPAPFSQNRFSRHQVSALVHAARFTISDSRRGSDSSLTVTEPLLLTLIWTKYARGHLQFSVGDQSVTLPFKGWADNLQPPPYVCSISGARTFHLAAADDGRILAADQIGVCSHSGQRVPRSELVQCHVTGEEVSAEFTEICPVVNRPVLREHFGPCSTCRQIVSLAALQRGQCAACRSLRGVSNDDPHWLALLEANPGLARWRRWYAAETQHCYIARGANLMRKLLVVCDKNSLRILHLAKGTRGLSGWSPLEVEHWQSELGRTGCDPADD